MLQGKNSSGRDNSHVIELALRNAGVHQFTKLPKAHQRLPKITYLLASKACRSSIMIGTGLSKRLMKRILENLSTIEQPWNCPHGRPTLQHLHSLNIKL